ncbi:MULTISPECIES: amidohydrolase [unclassified Sphingobacterium]|uniref:amidohydrolase n=1 Tax=unclassified Sphingobacterium TaxID=2609468 RepID=UPI00104DD16A|nr:MULTISPECIES: amidohydrolase [unclassified Sphingobacterium]MCS3553971.1 cytosine/adenosine deaminase-related metal-dependent hydrolase [Sphingobacterium sp. JUb21]TCR05290.1 cytosine/adenosine deaminase-related metal-dependent hydrolase [Sphingobacterium sp. JUb20]
MLPSHKLIAKGHYTLKNVRLETGFEYENQEVIGTLTDLFCIEIANGKIIAIKANNAAEEAVDMKGRLMLPAFKDMHIHIDKTLFGLPWQALSPKRKTVADMIAYEQEIIPRLLTTSTARAEQLIALLQGYGTTYARTHFNVDPTSGLQSFENLLLALEHQKDSFQAELVAFPQHGLYYTDSAPIMKEVAKSDRVDFIGGLDPLSIDGSIEKPMEFTVQLALDNNKGIDIHLHEAGPSGMKTIQYLIDKAVENPQLQGKIFISHAFALAQLNAKEVEEIAEKLAFARVGIASSVPFKGRPMPIPALKKHGVNVLIGNDNVQDYWSTFGTGNMLQKANLIAELYGYATELQLSRTLRFATQQLLPLDDEGKKQWPKANDDANLVFVDATCSAEAVSRMSNVHAFMHNGNLFVTD